MKNVDIAHHPFRGDFTVILEEPANSKSVEPYFKIIDNRITVIGGLVHTSVRGIRIQRLGQGVFLEPVRVRKIKVGWRTIWPENKFLRAIKDFFVKYFCKC